MIVVVDFGSQTAHLIARRIKDFGVAADIVSPSALAKHLEKEKPKGIIFSGSPAFVTGKDFPTVEKTVFQQGIPILGICYGQQLCAYLLGGKVVAGHKKEYGPALLTILQPTKLFANIARKTVVWMSHGDKVKEAPPGAHIVGVTDTSRVAAFADETRHLYGIQFHPEVIHTPEGIQILKNFVEHICHVPIKPKQLPAISTFVADIKKQIGTQHAVCALSGGIDSATTALLVHKAIGKRLTCIYVDTGCMRKGETEQVRTIFAKELRMNLRIIDAKDLFLRNLEGVTDPEKKRKIIGETFIRVFEKEAKKLGDVHVLVQGTIYPDVIESAGTALANNIKSHHNVGGLPQRHMFTLVEPLRFLYKDQVRMLARRLKLPKPILSRHMFPGPGLAVRIIGEVTDEKLHILREADAIVTEEFIRAHLYQKLWMGFAIFAGIKTTGVTGDERRYGETIAIRAITSKDAMTADFARVPYAVLGKIANRITNEIPSVVRVVYDITTKPPATMEWE